MTQAVANPVAPIATATTTSAHAFAVVARTAAVAQSTTAQAVTSPNGTTAVAAQACVPGPPGPAGGIRYLTAGADLLALSVVTIHEDDLAYPASSLNLDDRMRVAGVTLTSAAAGQNVQVAWDAEINTIPALPIGPYYVGPDGPITQDRDSGLYQLWIATALSPHRLLVRLDTYILLAKE